MLSGFIGGLLIGIASTIHLLLKGRVTGMSGIFNGMITLDESITWKSSIFSGLLFTSSIAYYIFGFGEVTNEVYLFDSPEWFNKRSRTELIMLAGFLVGFGTKLGNGCTSGHGVCGLPRFSIRSLAAVVTFMLTAFIMANISYYTFEDAHEEIFSLQSEDSVDCFVHWAVGVSVLILLVNILRNKKGYQGVIEIIISFAVGVIFSLGLLVSGMARKSKVLGFLTFNKHWDPALMFVMGGAVMLNLLTFYYIMRKRQKPVFGEKLNIPSNKKIDLKLVMGAALFGLGWGLGGICPGPAMVITPIYFKSMIQFMISMATGQYFAKHVEEKFEKSVGIKEQPQIHPPCKC